MKLKFIFAFVFLSCASFLKAQYAASNFTLLSLIDPEVGVNVYNDKYSACWGWVQPGNNREYAIACSKSGTYWVDVTNPLTPTISAFAAGTSSNGVWRETKTYQNYCYVVCDDNSSTGFQIFNMSTLPTTVSLVSSNNSLFKRGHTLWVDGNKLYVAGITYSNGATSSMNVYSLATPTAPVLLRRLNQDYNFITYVHDMYVRNDTVYASCGNQGLYVFKFNSGTNTFTQLGSLTSYTASGYNHSSCLTPDGQTLVFMDEVPSGLPIKTANVSNLGNIQVLATCNQFPQTTPHNPWVVNSQYCFVSAYQDGTQLWDISNPSAPFLAGYYDTFYQGGGNNNNWAGDAYDGQWGCYPYFPSRNIFALDQKNGIFMIKSHLFQNPQASFNTPSPVCPGQSVSITNTSSYCNTYTWTLTGGNPAVSNATNPIVVYNTPGIYTVVLSGSSLNGTASAVSQITVAGISTSTASTNASCGVCADGSATVTTGGGFAPYTYTWMPSGGNAATAGSLLPGCYTVTIQNNLNCTKTETVCVGFGTGMKANTNENYFLYYPNPVDEKLNVFYNSPESAVIQIRNVIGQIILEKNISGKSEETISLKNFTEGTYFISFKNSSSTHQGKIIIQH